MTTSADFEVVALIERELNKRWPETKIEPSLNRIAALCDALGSPQLSYPTIHIAGTNTNGLPITPEGIISTYNDVALYFDLIDSRQEHPISFFEAMTALAFVAFAEFPVDIAVIEAGMGGEWDATNVIQSQVSVLTPIGLDHMEYLGNTLEEIALTKSGIIKPETHVVLAAQKPEVATVLMARVLERAAIPYREGVEFAVKKRDLAVGGQLLTIDGIHGSSLWRSSSHKCSSFISCRGSFCWSSIRRGSGPEFILGR